MIEVARKQLVGRRFIDIFGPLGAGTQVVPVFAITSPSSGGSRVVDRHFLPLSSHYEDFSLSWQDIEAARQFGTPLELGPVAAAAVACAQKEDKQLFGDLVSKAGTDSPLGDWDASGAGLTSIAAAVGALTGNG
ncbi:MAG: bacteriocin family protein, partial [Actinobacteria bacterium]|nr:bacteriocin family protein [Actinomycetota bacterium]